MKVKCFKKMCIAALMIVAPSVSLSQEMTLKDLQQLSNQDIEKTFRSLSFNQEDSLRWKSLRSTALSVGAQYGYFKRMSVLQATLDSQQASIDAIFDFSTIMKLASTGEDQMFFLPPVIVEAENVMAVSDDNNTVRVSGTLYEIKRPAKLTLRPPNWRQYLRMQDDFIPLSPDVSLLPKNKEEREMWEKWVAEGWNAGIKQAEEEMRFRVLQLGEDYVGMVKYMRLVDEGKLVSPNISKLKRHSSGDYNTLRENEAVYNISIPAIFDKNPGHWNPIYGEARDSLLFPGEVE